MRGAYAVEEAAPAMVVPALLAAILAAGTAAAMAGAAAVEDNEPPKPTEPAVEDRPARSQGFGGAAVAVAVTCIKRAATTFATEFVQVRSQESVPRHL